MQGAAGGAKEFSRFLRSVLKEDLVMEAGPAQHQSRSGVFTERRGPVRALPALGWSEGPTDMGPEGLPLRDCGGGRGLWV